MTIEEQIKKVVKAQVKSAGPRYTPQIEEGAPNIQIDNLLKPLSCLSFNDHFRDEIVGLKNNLAKESANPGKHVSKVFRRKVRTPGALVGLLEEVIRAPLCCVSQSLRNAETVAKQCQRSLRIASSKIWDELSKIRRDSDDEDRITSRLDKKRQGLEYANQELRQLQSSIGDVINFLRSPSRRLLENNICFIEGGWGTGKTHTLCDLALSRIEQSKPTYFALGKNINGPEELARGAVDGLTDEQLFEYLDNAARALGERALIIVDGINEGDKELWFKGVSKLLQLAKSHPHVGVVLSVRSPFQYMCIPPSLYSKHTRIIHHGFENSEFDAQKEFFQFYNLSLPEVPILRDEFSRPLVLKIVCEQLADMTAENARSGFIGITSGQMGMTFVFEGFIKKIGKRLEDDHGLPRKFCWNIIKEYRVDTNNVFSLAETMAERSTDYVLYGDAIDLFFATNQFCTRKEAQDFLRVMVNEGLLIEGIHSTGYGENYSQEKIIQLPYQKFSDHIIARWLLKNHLNKSSEETIRRSFYANRALGKVFLLNENSWEREYAEPGLAEALMIEFPTRLKNKEFDDKRELVFYLPKDKRLVSPSVSPFLEGLYWRRPEGFGEDTNTIIRQLLSSKDEIAHNTLDALVVLALKPDHPFGYRRLHNYLSNMSMADRDEYWGEYLRKLYEEQSPWRLLEWVTKADCSNIPEDYISALVRVLSWMLVSVNRHFRDLATKALVLLGKEHPRALYKCCILALSSNDLYIPERMLAACYGVAMLNWHSAEEQPKRDLSVFARLLHKNIFSSGAKHATHHVLMRNYAAGVCAIAFKVDEDLFSADEIAEMLPPFHNIDSKFPEPDQITEETCESVEAAIHMDFGNYTIGRLVPDRGNYDEKHPEYLGVLKQIKWRMSDLGYNSDRFKDKERREYYGRQGNESGKIDRYGKKYSWIAYFEMYGLRQAQNLISDEKPSDSDVDPTFVDVPDSMNMGVPNFFTDPMTIEEWLEQYEWPDISGILFHKEDNVDWVVIDASLSSECGSDDRAYWYSLKAFLVKDEDVETFQSVFTSDASRSEFVHTPETWSVYFGEIPWMNNLANPFQGCLSPAFKRQFTISEYVEDQTAELVPEPEIRINDEIVFGGGARRPGEWVKRGGVDCIQIVSSYLWGESRSLCNKASGVRVLATEVAGQLDLGLRTMSTELFDRNGVLAVSGRNVSLPAKYPGSSCLLMRKDLADLLTSSGLTLIFAAMGEKDIKIDSSYRKHEYDIPKYPDHIREILQKNRNEVRQVYSYREGDLNLLGHGGPEPKYRKYCQAIYRTICRVILLAQGVIVRQ